MRIVALSLALLAGCTSTKAAITSAPLLNNEEIGVNVEGSAGGFMLFQFIPIGQNDRFERAYRDALAKAPGAIRLVNVEVWESWYWAYVGNGYVFHLSGQAVRTKARQ